MTGHTIDRLLEACANSASYPTQLLRSELFPYALQKYKELIDERESRVFSRDSESEYWTIRFLDFHSNQQRFPSTSNVYKCNSTAQLDKYLKVYQKEPRCRHIFIRAPHSRAPLDCSREMLSLVLTFHQVMAQFLDVILFFGTLPGINVPTAFHRCVFRHERFVDPEDASRFSIPQLGRSGMEIRYCYNLWSVEKSDSKYGKRAPWEIRQAGLYHSLDISSGRATWIHIKANKLLETRIQEAYSSVELLRGGNLQSLQGSFSASLLTHLILFEWCSENWRQYLHYWECELERILTTIRKAPINKVEKVLVDVKSNIADILGSTSQPLLISPPTTRRGTMSSNITTHWGNSRRVTSINNSSTPVQSSGAEKPSLVDFLQPVALNLNKQSPALTPSPDILDSPADTFQIFEEFKFEDLQRLHHIGSKLHEADMIMKLDTNILLEIMEYLKCLVNDSQTPKALRDGCQGALSKFMQRTLGIVRELETERTRIVTLTALLNDGKALFDAITQFRNMELNQLSSARMEIMTKDMHQSTLQMETIAGKTEKETSSMHIITLVTLLFLPGTFVATFLGAGFYQWPESDDSNQIPNSPVWRPEYFVLFAKISFPLMALTVLFWTGPYVLRWLSGGRSCGIVDRKWACGVRSWTCGIGSQNRGDEEAQTFSNDTRGQC